MTSPRTAALATGTAGRPENDWPDEGPGDKGDDNHGQYAGGAGHGSLLSRQSNKFLSVGTLGELDRRHQLRSSPVRTTSNSVTGAVTQSPVFVVNTKTPGSTSVKAVPPPGP